MIKCVRIACFSPTGKTKAVALAIGEGAAKNLRLDSCGQVQMEQFDFTLPKSREQKLCFSSDDLAIIALPVYAGRLPNKILPYVHGQLCGNHTPAVAVVTYGNRSCDDALIELKNELTDAGFDVIGAVSAVSEHAFSEKLAPGRPDATDQAQLIAFGKCVSDTLCGLQNDELLLCKPLSSMTGNNPPGPYYVPKKENGEPAVFLKAKPVVQSSLCDGCGLCAQVCPMGSIMLEKPHETTGICIKCQACIKACPKKARFFDDADFLSHVRMLEERFLERKTNAYYLN